MDLHFFINDCKGNMISDAALNGLTVAQQARIIYRSRNTGLTDKHHALQEIIDTLPDETVQCTNYETKLPFEQSLHQLLKDYIAEQKKLEDDFFTTEPEVVYLVDLSQPVTGEFWSGGEPSLSWEACARKLTDYLEWFENTGPWRAAVTKYYPKVYLNGFMREITAEFNAFGELLDITSRMQIPLPKLREITWHLEQLPIAHELYVPAAFHKGDILMPTPAAQKKYPNLPHGPMLLMEEPNLEKETVSLFCFDLYRQHPEIRNLHLSILQPFVGENQSTSYLILKEIASALERGDSLTLLNQRIGAALTYYADIFFSKEKNT